MKYPSAKDIEKRNHKIEKKAVELIKNRTQEEINILLDDILKKVYDFSHPIEVEWLSDLFNECAKYLEQSVFFIVQETDNGDIVLNKQYKSLSWATKYMLKHDNCVIYNKKGKIHIHKNDNGVFFSC